MFHYTIEVFRDNCWFKESRYYHVEKSIDDFDLHYIPGKRRMATFEGISDLPKVEEQWIEHFIKDDSWPTFPENEKAFDWRQPMKDIDRKYRGAIRKAEQIEMQQSIAEKKRLEYPNGIPSIEHNMKLLSPKRKKSKSLVGGYLEREKERTKVNVFEKTVDDPQSYIPGRTETMQQFLNRTKSTWEFNKRPNETLAQAEERRRMAALPLLEKIKLSLKEPEDNFHESE